MQVGNDFTRFPSPGQIAAARRAKLRYLLVETATAAVFVLLMVEIYLGLWISTPSAV